MTPPDRTLVVSLLSALALAALAVAGVVAAQGGGTALERSAPEIVGGPWINSPPLAAPALRGRVVVVEFWTYG